MSRLIDKLKKSYQDAIPSIGFKTRTDSESNQNMPFIVSLSSKNFTLIPDILTLEIDALLLQISDNDDTENIFTSLSNEKTNIPWGLRMNNFSDEQIDQYMKAGCDFIIFEAEAAPVSCIEQEKMGKLLIINQSFPDELIETAGQLPIDAIVFDLQKETRPSIMHLMLCQYYAELTDKPLFSIVSTEIDASMLEVLHKYGVDGIITEIRTKSSLKQLIDFRQRLNKLPPVKDRRKRQRLTPFLGAPSSTASDDEYEEEEF